MSKACVVIKYSRYTIPDTVDVSSHRRKSGLLQGKMTVNGPPLSIQNIQKALGIISFNTQTSGKRAVDMLMGIDKCRHDNSASGIYKFSIWICFFHLICSPHHNYGVTIHCNCTVLYKCLGCVPCDHSSITNNKHMASSFTC